jgi:hypothetical protein
MERRGRQEKKRMDKIFFQQMEQNIRDSLQRGEIVPGDVPPTLEMEEGEDTAEASIGQQQPVALRSHEAMPPPIRSRTISGMDETLLRELHNPAAAVQTVAHTAVPRRDAHGRPPLPARTLKMMDTQPSELSLEFSPEEAKTDKKSSQLASPVSNTPLVALPPLLVHPLTREESDQTELRGEALLDGLLLGEEEPYEANFVATKPPRQPVHNHVRRNTGTTIYAGSTMMNPDVEKTIKVRYMSAFLLLVYSLVYYLKLTFVRSHSTVRLWCVPRTHCASIQQTIQSFTRGCCDVAESDSRRYLPGHVRFGGRWQYGDSIPG